MREFRFILTPFCNYQCFFCHGESSSKDVNLMLKTSDYEFLGEVGRKLGWTTATITGGEPLISPIFEDVCEKLDSLGIGLTVVTNASLLARPAIRLRNVKQINVSLHTMNPDKYKQIIQVNYPLERVLDTLIETRALLPNLEIHLNYTVIKSLNDTTDEFEELLNFAHNIRAEAKFIDLSSTDPNLATSADDIMEDLTAIGFRVIRQDDWQYELARGQEKAKITRCPFNGKYDNLPARDIFVDTNGTFFKSYGGYLSINALNDIKARDSQKLIQKINVLLSRG